MKTISYVKQYAKANNQHICIITGTLKDGREGYFLILPKPGMQDSLLKATNPQPIVDIGMLMQLGENATLLDAVTFSTHVDLEFYGTVLASGYGKEPPESLIQSFI
jgi:hypothetical protein